MLFEERDREIQKYFINSAQPSVQEFNAVIESLAVDAQGNAPNRTLVFARSGLHPTKATVILAELVEQGIVEKHKQNGGQVYVRTSQSGDPDLSRYSRQFEIRNGELDAMLAYGQGQVACLMPTLRAALGDVSAEPCGRCSVCVAANHTMESLSSGQVASARNWLTRRELPIPATTRPRMSAGLTLLDAESRSPPYVDFMKNRANPERDVLSDAVAGLLGERVKTLAARHEFQAVVVLPSRTWHQRLAVASMITQQLQVPLFADTLVWTELPERRQGELLNNDQRRENIKGRMTVSGSLPAGAVLLLDDYIGSSATVREAVRTLRRDGGFAHDIVPLTIARVRWRLGAAGMI